MLLALPIFIYEAYGEHKKDVSHDPRFCNNIGREFETVADTYLTQFRGSTTWHFSDIRLKSASTKEPDCYSHYKHVYKIEKGTRFRINQIQVMGFYDTERSSIYILTDLNTEIGTVEANVEDLFKGCYTLEPNSIEPKTELIIEVK